jgi:hypothetical protein
MVGKSQKPLTERQVEAATQKSLEKKPGFGRGGRTNAQGGNNKLVDILERCLVLPEDGYYVRRWLWVQFPLLALALER